MKVERIAFRFQKEELQVLIKLLGIGSLPGTETDPAVDEENALQSLIDDGIVQSASAEALLVDRAVSLILMNAAAYERCIIIESGRTCAVLFKGKLFYVILCTDEGVSSLCPIKEWKQAYQQFLQEATRIHPVRFAAMEKGADLNWEDVPQDGLIENLGQRLSLYIGRED